MKRGRRRRKCAWCGAWFTPKARGRPPRFCRDSHRQRAFEHRREEKRAQDAASQALGRDLADAKRLGERSLRRQNEELLTRIGELKRQLELERAYNAPATPDREDGPE